MYNIPRHSLDIGKVLGAPGGLLHRDQVLDRR